jgi:hypothetical protein
MLTVSISSTETMPTATPEALARISTASRSRVGASSCLESLMPSISVSGGNITDAATTGPASGAMPASSTPAMSLMPDFHRSFSK